jgi:hypothetical protein
MAQDAARWRRIESVVQAALERPPHARAAFLAEACGADEDLRREAASLLEREASAEAFLAAPLDAVAAAAMTGGPGGTSRADVPRIAPGTRIGEYEVGERIGAGGMGEVYRARDHALHRNVALKVLPTAFSADPDRLARFEREARLLASLNHPHIGAVYGLRASGDLRAIVLELIDGETLEAHIRRGALPATRALPLAVQVADALAHAHRHGVMHRDLKPANIMLTKAGAKLLDFGLARWGVTPRGYVPSGVDPPVHSAGVGTLTGQGTILGTLHYMAPEQLEGRPVDVRADVFAFGAVLYEMLTGRKAFDGGSAPAVMAAVLGAEPAFEALHPVAPPAVERLVRKCLAKDPDERWQTARDLADELTWIVDEATHARAASAAPAAAARRPRTWMRAALAAVIATLAVWTGWALAPAREVAAPRPVTRFSIFPPSATAPGWFAIAPDASEVVYSSNERAGAEPRLLIRRFDQFEDAAIAGTEEGRFPFYSPDGQWVAFFTRRRLMKVNVRTVSAPVVLCECRGGYNGATWLPDGSIVFTQLESGLLRVSADGGEPVAITSPATAPREFDHHNPAALPDPGVILYTAHAATGQWDVVAQTLATGARKVLIPHAYDARYLPSGHLVFARDGAIQAAPFDAARLELTGPTVTLVDRVLGAPVDGYGGFQVSADGTALAYRPDPSPDGRTLVWVSRTGEETPVPLAPRAFSSPRVSPDGTRLAFAVTEQGRSDIFVYEIGTQRLRQLTREGDNTAPLWTRDGRRIVYASTRSGVPSLWWEPDDGSGVPELIVADRGGLVPGSWSADGRTLYYAQWDTGPAAGRTLSVDLFGDRSPRLLLPDVQTFTPKLSPDGRWLALTASGSRTLEAQVTDPAGVRPRRPVSNGLGLHPLWRRDGREIVYRAGEHMYAVAVDTTDGFRHGVPTLLFERGYVRGGSGNAVDYDLAPDGRFLMMKPSLDEIRANRLNVVLNWMDEVKRRAPAR